MAETGITKELYEAKHEALKSRVTDNERKIDDVCKSLDSHLGQIYDKVNVISTNLAVVSSKMENIPDIAKTIGTNNMEIAEIKERLKVQEERENRKIPTWQVIISIAFFVLTGIFNILINAEKIKELFK